MMKKITIVLLLLVAAIAENADNKMKYKNPTGKEFPILAWYSILPDSNLTRERYMELRNAGFNISFWPVVLNWRRKRPKSWNISRTKRCFAAGSCAMNRRQ